MVAEQLDPRVRACIKKRGFTRLSPAQEQAIPIVLAKKNLVLIAPTGTGKTESAMFPVFDALLKMPAGGGFKALYITPLRSLNRDILSRMEWWCHELGLTVGVRHGDTPMAERRKQALSPPDLLITTPETLQALFMGKRLKKHLEHVQFVIVDEIHEMAASKRGAQLAVALERLAEYAGEFQRIGLSATVGNPETIATFLCGARPCGIVQVPVAKQLAITVTFVGDNFKHQVQALDRLLKNEGSTLVFVNTRVTAEALGHALYSRGDVEVHHGSLSKEIRIDAEERFKKGEIKTLICTSSMELGIDIGRVDHVIQFGSPREVARLVQRVGRAGHQLNTISRGTILATGFDDLLESLVIARRAKANEIEPVVPDTNAADVLANQVAAIAVEYGEIDRSRVRTIVERSSLFFECGKLLDDVCAQLEEHRVIRIDGSRIVTTARARRYLSGNLSMIHDERKIPIFDMVSRRTVGTLDESFVVGWVHTGAVFITKGQLWRVLDIDDGRLTVEPAKKAIGELPSWEGEQIPVPFAVAREVGAIRRERTTDKYTAEKESIAFATHILSEMEKNRCKIPTDRLITFENIDDGVVCNVCAGHKSNEALGRVLSILISARFGTTVGIELDAYRILLRLPSAVRAADVRDFLLSLEPAHMPGILKLALKRTALFKWKLVQIAKKFGAIDPDADYEKISIQRLLDYFDNTVVQQEAYRELLSGYMDIDAAAGIVGMVKAKEIELAIGPHSIIGADGILSSRDQIPPPTADQAVIATLKRRLEQDEVVLACMNCRDWKSKTVVSRVPEQPQCPKCGARLIAALKPYEADAYDTVIRKKKKTGEERALEQRLLRNANIVLSSGKKAVVALSARGVGPENASRILATLSDGDAFYREILKAERTFIQTHRYWA
ncbi:DEAD/DEAH box helicase [Methanoregula sp. UBA64]|jgi:ATP-dependent helicase Lhr and Lhr-like helicase|uniref:DEAD/DEAH box helicase n=1 Tax=Methanoregula sp. UBA64 TaxID=1915554 RepID=UPI0025F50A22|nr:DEAD/DEAH box helicase [Methanoregula sp. UBA64]